MNAPSRFFGFLTVVWSLAFAPTLPAAHSQPMPSATTAPPTQVRFPDKPLRLLVPYEFGGTTDLLGRLLATALSSRLGQPVAVENKPGSGTALAAELLAQAAPDGYTLMLASVSTLVLHPVLYGKQARDPANSFTQLGMVAELQLLALAAPGGPTSMPALLGMAKANPGSVTYGAVGTGSSTWFVGEMLKSMTDTPLQYAAFDGSASNLKALTDGKITTALDTLVASLPLIKEAKVLPLATFAPHRLDVLPLVPTMIELGYPELTLTTWYALIAPKGLGTSVREELEDALLDVAASPDFRSHITELGFNPFWIGGSRVIKRIRSELPRMKGIVLLDGIKG